MLRATKPAILFAVLSLSACGPERPNGTGSNGEEGEGEFPGEGEGEVTGEGEGELPGEGVQECPDGHEWADGQCHPSQGEAPAEGEGEVSPPGPGSLTLSIEHRISDQALTLGEDVVVNGTTLNLDFVRYWLSNLRLVSNDGAQYEVPDAYYLIEETGENTRTAITLDGIPDGEYERLVLAVGVDEDHNHSIDRFVGELSAAVDMSWSWNSGFIFFKSEGTYDGGNDYKMHVGSDDLYRVIELELPSALIVDEGSTTSIKLTANLDTLFTEVDVTATPSIVGGPVDSPAGSVAQAYYTWFSVAEVQGGP